MISDILRAAMFCPMPEGNWGAPVLLSGESGTGKTSSARAVAEAANLLHYRLAPSERGEGQFGVVPVPGADGYLHYPPPDWSKLVDEHGGLLFVDEIDSVPLALQAPLLGLVQLRTIGSHTFNTHVRVIGAANGVNGTWELREDIRNRFCHVEFEGYTADEWTSNLLSGFNGHAKLTSLSATDLETAVMAQWPAEIAVARGLVSGFIHRRPELLHKRPTRGSQDKAWPSRRTCEYVTVAMAASKIHGLTESDTDLFAGGFVGSAWMREFRAWASFADLPDTADFLDGKVRYEHDPRRLDRTMAVLGACAALVIPKEAKRRNERVTALWKFIEVLTDDASDIVMPAARAILKAGIVLPEVQTSALKKIWPILAAAGVTGA